MAIKYLVLFLLLFSTLYASTEETDFSKERRRVIHLVLRKFKQAMQAKGLNAAGIGEGIDHNNDKQNYLKVVFDIDKLPDVDFARRLEVETLQEFLHYINSQEDVQDYLAEYPFPLKFIHIGFISRHPEEGLFSVSNNREKLRYTKNNPANPLGPLIEVHEESYGDAVRILAQ